VKIGFKTCVRDAHLKDLHPSRPAAHVRKLVGAGGCGIERVSELVRHGDVARTARVYAHLEPTDLAEAVAILDPTERSPTGTHFHADFYVGPGRTGEDDTNQALTG
jgi:hypothetical protein